MIKHNFQALASLTALQSFVLRLQAGSKRDMDAATK